VAWAIDALCLDAVLVLVLVDPMRAAASAKHLSRTVPDGSDDAFYSDINLQCLHPSPASSCNLDIHRRDACLILLLGANFASDLGANQGKKNRDWSTEALEKPKTRGDTFADRSGRLKKSKSCLNLMCLDWMPPRST
jgi:hypothetical protein